MQHDHHWKQAANEHFHRWAEHYDRDIINVLLFHPCYRRVLTELRHWQRLGLDNYHVLDVGCGTGTLGMMSMTLSGLGRYTGLDMSENMIAKANAKIDRTGTDDKLRFVVGDAENLPFDDNSFDVLTCCNSFHHYPHQDRAVAEMRRVLKPDGRLMLIDGFRDNVIGWFVFDVCVERVEKHVHHCSAERFEKLITDAGFANLNQHTFGVCPPAIANIARAGK